MRGAAPPASRQARLAWYRTARQRLDPRHSLAVFESLVAEALDDLPAYIAERMENVAVVVEETPAAERLEALGYDSDQDLLGLYEGIPRHERGGGYHLVVPDRITLYRQPILDEVGAGGRPAVVEEIRRTVIHEVAHHFGITDEELEQLEGSQRPRPWRAPE